jgi:branched-chain amino acid transport system ATP-binding protein
LLLETRDLDIYYGTSYVGRQLSISVDEGEVVALLGRNGAGKTTALKAMTGIVRPRSGQVLLEGRDVTNAEPHERARRGVGYVPQGRLLFNSLTVLQNLTSVARGGRDVRDLVFELFPMIKDRLAQKAGTLSGGEQQMVAIARALVTKPRVLLLDEPSTGLMPTVVARVEVAIRRLRDEGIGVLLVEEKVPVALNTATRFFIMDTGAIVHEGDQQSILGGDLLIRHLGMSA